MAEIKYIILSIITILLITSCNITSTSTIQETEINKPKLTITFDDNRSGVINNGFEILNNYNLTATLYVNSGLINNYSYMTEYEIKYLQEQGWELGSHTTLHQDLLSIPIDSARQVMIQDKNNIESIFNTSVKAFASPYGNYNSELINEIKTIYQTHVNAWSPEKGINNINSVDKYNIHREDITSDKSAEYVCNKINNLKENEWYVILFHNILSAPQGNWDTSNEKLASIAKCIDDSGVEVNNLSEILKKL